MKQSAHQFHKKDFHISKCLACNAKKNTTVDDQKKKMNLANFRNTYTNTYTYIICDENDSK